MSTEGSEVVDARTVSKMVEAAGIEPAIALKKAKKVRTLRFLGWRCGGGAERFRIPLELSKRL